MKLLRYGPAGAEKPGLLDANGTIRDLAGELDDLAGGALDPANIDRLAALDPAALPAIDGNPRLGSPVHERVIFAIGLNYAEHAAEAGVPVPDEPIVFNKSGPATGHRDDIVIPRGSRKSDWEVELVMVIGRKAEYVSAADALDYVAGYCAGNDVSERAFMLEGSGQWVKGKGCDTFAPMGPWLVTPDEVGDPQNLDLWLEVNGRRMQAHNTADMIYSCAKIIESMTSMITLHPGDVVFTGTPQGVGNAMKPPVYLQPGDEVRMGVDKLGEHHNRCVAYSG